MIETLPAHRDPATIAAVERGLDELSARCSMLIVAIVLTDDGFEVARSAGEPDPRDQRLASMGSTLQALGEAVARELKLGETGHVAVAGARGSMIVRRIGELPFVLVAVFGAAREDDVRVSQEIATQLTAALARQG